MTPKILIACEESQRVCKAFRKKGFKAYSCDILDCSGNKPKWHIKGDAINEAYKGDYHLIIAHPPCTYLTVAGNRWMKPEYRDRFPNRPQQRKEAIEFFLELYNAPAPHVAIENPSGIMSTEFRKPDQYVHPYHFGEPHSKRTGFWLKNLPKLKPTKIVEPEWYVYKNGKRDPMWHRKTLDLPKEERTRVRSMTYKGIAKAMAEQWGAFIL